MSAKKENHYKSYLQRVLLVFLLAMLVVVLVFFFLQYALKLNAEVKELGFDSPELQDNNQKSSN